MKYAIKHRYTDAVLYEADIPDDTPSGLQCRVALEKATAARANLAGAFLAGAYLARANLDGAFLAGANLAGANLDGAFLAGANLDGAFLAGAYLARANLDGAFLAGKKLIGARPVFQIGPIGSRCAQFVSYITEAGVLLNAGCFWGTVDEFRAKLADTHGNNDHAKEYEMALLMIDAHAAIWTPKEEA
jgi:uncharacterized protein YjbI with pentapeptide repeats